MTRRILLLALAVVCLGCNQAPVEATATEVTPLENPRQTIDGLPVYTEAELRDLEQKAMEAQACNCEAGEAFQDGWVILSSTGQLCELWYVCKTMAVCPNVPREPATLWLFGYFKPEARNCQ